MEIIDVSIMSCVVVYALNTVVDLSDKFVHFRNLGRDSFKSDYVFKVIINE